MRMLLSFLLIFIFSIATPAFAQTASSAQPAPIEYSVTPQNPGPNQSIEITATGVGSFLGNASITWSQGNKVLSSGTGDSSFTFTTGALGSESIITVTINSPSEGTFTHTFTISPSLTNLVWEANTSVPLFYKGLPLYSPGSTVTVVAFPEIVVNKFFISSKALSFQWSLHGTLVPEQSGLGKTTFAFQGDQLQSSEEVSVVEYYNGTQVGEGDITIPATSPQLLFYIRDPLRGELFDTGLVNSTPFQGTEMTLQAEPYYFATDAQGNNNLTYQWTVNGQDVSGPDSNKGILTLRQNGNNSSGAATVGLTIQNTNSDQILQSANTVLQLLFGQQSSLSF